MYTDSHVYGIDWIQPFWEWKRVTKILITKKERRQTNQRLFYPVDWLGYISRVKRYFNIYVTHICHKQSGKATLLPSHVPNISKFQSDWLPVAHGMIEWEVKRTIHTHTFVWFENEVKLYWPNRMFSQRAQKKIVKKCFFLALFFRVDYIKGNDFSMYKI